MACRARGACPGGLPCHSADKPPPTLRRSCQSGDARSNRGLESQDGSPPRDHQAPAGQTSTAAAASGTRLDGHAGECRLFGSCRSHGPWRLRVVPRARQPEMGEDPLNDGRVLNRGDELHPPGTAGTTQDVQVERSAHERRPRPVAWRTCASAPRLGHYRARIRRSADVRAPIGDDLRSPPCMRGECAVVWVCSASTELEREGDCGGSSVGG
jgi:hypothetical protein